MEINSDDAHIPLGLQREYTSIYTQYVTNIKSAEVASFIQVKHNQKIKEAELKPLNLKTKQNCVSHCILYERFACI